MVKPVYRSGLLGICLLCLLSFTTNIADIGQDDPSPPKSPADELATFQLEPGLKIQLVAAEPMVQDPVVITFDEDGRLWVVEMRGFMTTIDGKEERERIGRVSVLEDTNGDGLMDVSKVYLDSLILPRALALVPGGALVAENEALWLTQDLNGDLKADTKTLIDAKYAGSGLPEHAGNGLWRGMDNWYYNAKSRVRYRLVAGKWKRDSTEFRGQWGLSHDDEGHLFYNYNWSQLHADLVPANYLSRNKNHSPTTGIDHGLTVDRRIYPIRPTPAVNRGYVPGTLDKEGKILEFTAACSPFVYRETTLPKAFYGNAFVCEPAGNLIKRNVVEHNELLLTAHDPHPGREFLASTDERFRPVHMTTGPDGALYVADMYRGLIQHGAYITPYLKEQTLSRNLVLPVHCGRIWRIVPENWQASKPRKMSMATTDELVASLSSASGWQRDMAQRLLVERQDKAAGPLLENVALKGANPYGRLQALWALDGLRLSNPDLLFTLLSDKSPVVRANALRLLEPFARDDQSIRDKLALTLPAIWSTAPIEQILQMALTAQLLEPKVAQPLLANIADRYGASALIRDAVMSSLYNQEFTFLQRLWKAPRWQTKEAAKEIMLETLTAAIVRKRDPSELTSLLTLVNGDGKTIGWKQNAVLTGLSVSAGDSKQKPIQLAASPALLTRPAGQVPVSKRAALSTLFTWPGHTVQLAQVQKKNPLGPEEMKLFAAGRQHYLTTCAGCHGTDGAGLKRFAPPLIGSDWVTGDGKRLALILLHGMEGPVDVTGKVYNSPDILPVMPSHSTLDDAVITAILTYIRNEWGNDAGPVNRRLVGMTRVMSQGRVVPWTAKDLNAYMQENKTPNENGK